MPTSNVFVIINTYCQTHLLLLANLVMRAQAWFLDQFGVLHDGKQPYPGAISTCMFSFVTFGILISFFLSEIVYYLHAR